MLSEFTVNIHYSLYTPYGKACKAKEKNVMNYTKSRH